MPPNRKPLMSESEKFAFINTVFKEKRSIETIDETFGRIKYDTHQFTVMHPSDVEEIIEAIKPPEAKNATQ